MYIRYENTIILFLDLWSRYINQDVAYQLALGNLSVHNMKAISDFDPDTFQVMKMNLGAANLCKIILFTCFKNTLLEYS